MPVRLITPPALEPVTLAEAKAHLRLVESALDDVYIASLIVAARQYAEKVCWRGLVTQTWELVLDSFCGEDTHELGYRGRPFMGSAPWIELPKGNLGTVTSIKYIDASGTEITLAASEYTADSADVPGRIRLAYGKAWPQTRQQWDAVVIRYTVGWAVADVPMPVKHAILLLISQMYEHRTPEVRGTIMSSVSFAFDALIAPYRLVRI